MRWANGLRFARAAAIPREVLEQYLPKRLRRTRKPRRSDRERVETGRVSLAKLPGNVRWLTRDETAAALHCSIRQVQRMDEDKKLRRGPQYGREVTYDSRDVDRLASAQGKER